LAARGDFDLVGSVEIPPQVFSRPAIASALPTDLDSVRPLAGPFDGFLPEPVSRITAGFQIGSKCVHFRPPGHRWLVPHQGPGVSGGASSCSTERRQEGRREIWYRFMKLRDGLILLAIVGGLAFMFALTRYGQPARVKPGSPEYAAYIERYVAECLRNGQPSEPTSVGHSGTSEADREAVCRTNVLQADRFNPDGRPLKDR